MSYLDEHDTQTVSSTTVIVYPHVDDDCGRALNLHELHHAESLSSLRIAGYVSGVRQTLTLLFGCNHDRMLPIVVSTWRKTANCGIGIYRMKIVRHYDEL